MSLSTHLQNTWVVRYGQHVARFVATRVGAWARHIIVGAMVEVVEEAHRVVVVCTIRCAAFDFFFCSTDIPQSERSVHAFPGWVSSHHHQKRPLLHARCVHVCHLDLGQGCPLQPSNPLAGKSSESYTFFRLECSLTTCHVVRRFGSPQLASLGGGGSGSSILPQQRRQQWCNRWQWQQWWYKRRWPASNGYSNFGASILTTQSIPRWIYNLWDFHCLIWNFVICFLCAK